MTKALFAIFTVLALTTLLSYAQFKVHSEKPRPLRSLPQQAAQQNPPYTGKLSVSLTYSNQVVEGVTNVYACFRLKCHVQPKIKRVVPPSVEGSCVIQHADTTRYSPACLFDEYWMTNNPEVERDAEFIPTDKIMTTKVKIRNGDTVINYQFYLFGGYFGGSRFQIDKYVYGSRKGD